MLLLYGNGQKSAVKSTTMTILTLFRTNPCPLLSSSNFLRFSHVPRLFTILSVSVPVPRISSGTETHPAMAHPPAVKKRVASRHIVDAHTSAHSAHHAHTNTIGIWHGLTVGMFHTIDRPDRRYELGNVSNIDEIMTKSRRTMSSSGVKRHM